MNTPEIRRELAGQLFDLAEEAEIYEAEEAIERALEEPSAVWEAIGQDGVPYPVNSYQMAEVESAICQAIIDNDPEELGEIILTFSRPYLAQIGARR